MQIYSILLDVFNNGEGLNPCGELMVWYSSKGLVDDLKLFILQLRQSKKKTQMEQMKS